ncbi:MAG: nicotianamine synthase family protein [Alphaproteobacteria bacterium]|nr:nicotianamine synthase family protein [Alphaproteobacteria bacterium]
MQAQNLSLIEQDIFNVFNKTNIILSAQKDFSPDNNIINTYLTNLINDSLVCNKFMCENCPNLMNKFCQCNLTNSLRDISYKSEVEMEKFWGKKFANLSNISYESLKSFWYFKQYHHITSQEKSLIDLCENKISKIAFIGSGSLPLTAVILDYISDNKYEIDLIDLDAEAIEISKIYCSKISPRLNFICSDCLEVDYSTYDLVFVASMIPCKQELIEKIYNQNVQKIIVRDAEKLSQLFYTPVNFEDFGNYKVQKYISGDEMSVNSSYLLTK